MKIKREWRNVSLIVLFCLVFSLHNSWMCETIIVRDSIQIFVAFSSELRLTCGHYAEQNKLIRERQLSYGFTRLWNIRNSTEDQRGREGKLSGKSSKREKTPWETLNCRKQTESSWGEVGRGCVKWMGIKEGTWCDENWVLYATDELLNSRLKVIMYYICWLIEFTLKKNDLLFVVFPIST